MEAAIPTHNTAVRHMWHQTLPVPVLWWRLPYLPTTQLWGMWDTKHYQYQSCDGGCHTYPQHSCEAHVTSNTTSTSLVMEAAIPTHNTAVRHMWHQTLPVPVLWWRLPYLPTTQLWGTCDIKHYQYQSCDGGCHTYPQHSCEAHVTSNTTSTSLVMEAAIPTHNTAVRHMWHQTLPVPVLWWRLPYLPTTQLWGMWDTKHYQYQSCDGGCHTYPQHSCEACVTSNTTSTSLVMEAAIPTHNTAVRHVRHQTLPVPVLWWRLPYLPTTQLWGMCDIKHYQYQSCDGGCHTYPQHSCEEHVTSNTTSTSLVMEAAIPTHNTAVRHVRHQTLPVPVLWWRLPYLPTTQLRGMCDIKHYQYQSCDGGCHTYPQHSCEACVTSNTTSTSLVMEAAIPTHNTAVRNMWHQTLPVPVLWWRLPYLPTTQLWGTCDIKHYQYQSCDGCCHTYPQHSCEAHVTPNTTSTSLVMEAAIPTHNTAVRHVTPNTTSTSLVMEAAIPTHNTAVRHVTSNTTSTSLVMEAAIPTHNTAVRHVTSNTTSTSLVMEAAIPTHNTAVRHMWHQTLLVPVLWWRLPYLPTTQLWGTCDTKHYQYQSCGGCHTYPQHSCEAHVTSNTTSTSLVMEAAIPTHNTAVRHVTSNTTSTSLVMEAAIPTHNTAVRHMWHQTLPVPVLWWRLPYLPTTQLLGMWHQTLPVPVLWWRLPYLPTTQLWGTCDTKHYQYQSCGGCHTYPQHSCEAHVTSNTTSTSLVMEAAIPTHNTAVRHMWHQTLPVPVLWWRLPYLPTTQLWGTCDINHYQYQSCDGGCHTYPQHSCEAHVTPNTTSTSLVMEAAIPTHNTAVRHMWHQTLPVPVLWWRLPYLPTTQLWGTCDINHYQYQSCDGGCHTYPQHSCEAHVTPNTTSTSLVMEAAIPTHNTAVRHMWHQTLPVPVLWWRLPYLPTTQLWGTCDTKHYQYQSCDGRCHTYPQHSCEACDIKHYQYQSCDGGCHTYPQHSCEACVTSNTTSTSLVMDAAIPTHNTAVRHVTSNTTSTSLVMEAAIPTHNTAVRHVRHQTLPVPVLWWRLPYLPTTQLWGMWDTKHYQYQSCDGACHTYPQHSCEACVTSNTTSTSLVMEAAIPTHNTAVRHVWYQTLPVPVLWWRLPYLPTTQLWGMCDIKHYQYQSCDGGCHTYPQHSCEACDIKHYQYQSCDGACHTYPQHSCEACETPNTTSTSLVMEAAIPTHNTAVRHVWQQTLLVPVLWWRLPYLPTTQLWGMWDTKHY